MLDISLESFIPAFLLTVLAGLSTGIGALLAFFPNQKAILFYPLGLVFHVRCHGLCLICRDTCKVTTCF